jgi:hypothetical protein
MVSNKFSLHVGRYPNLFEWQLHEVSLNRATGLGKILHLAQIIPTVYLVFVDSNLQVLVSLRAQKQFGWFVYSRQ